MVNMKRSKRKESDGLAEPTMMDEPRYPYGLCINLGKEELGKLGITSLPKVGSGVSITAKAYVESTRASEESSGIDINMSLQITDLELGSIAGDTDIAAALYGNK